MLDFNEKEFFDCLEKGDLEKVKDLYSKNKIDIHKYNEFAFRKACYHNHLEIAKWIYSLGRVDVHVMNKDVFTSTCFRGHLEVAQWLYSLGGFNNSYYSLEMACYGGHLEIVKWLFSLSDIRYKFVDNHIFREVCKKGHLKVAKWIYSNFFDRIKINELFNNYDLYDINKHKEIVKWIEELKKIKILENYDLVIDIKGVEKEFVEECSEGNFEKVKELYSIHKFDIHFYNELPFLIACSKGHLDIAKWIYSFGDVNIHILNDIVFLYTCGHGHLEIAKWLFSLGDVNIHAKDDKVFRITCQGGHLEVAKWLYSFGKIKINEFVKNHHFCNVTQHEEIRNWIEIIDDSKKITKDKNIDDDELEFTDE
jgi:hypothetical protein